MTFDANGLQTSVPTRGQATNKPAGGNAHIPLACNDSGPDDTPLFAILREEPAVAGERLICADNLEFMAGLPDACCDLVYADPPFFTGKRHSRMGGRPGSSARTLRAPSSPSCADSPTRHEVADTWPGGLESYLEFLRPRIEQMRRLLRDTGTLYVHLDWHAVHYVKVMLDGLFGYDHFLSEIIWSYRTGGRNTRWLARKHDTILAYARTVGRQKFNVLREGKFRTDGMNYDENGRPYKQTRSGRLYFHPDGPALTDVWEIPFLSTVSLERNGYPTQKPEILLDRIIRMGSDPGDTVADFFCGSGTTLAVAARLGRRWFGCDIAPEAVALARARLALAPEGP